MPARSFAVTAQKGGVSKTTTAVNLSAALALRDKRVLLVDMDPQANATFHLNVNSEDHAGKGTYEVLTKSASAKDAIIRGCRTNLDLMPASDDLALAEAEIMAEIGREKFLAQGLEPVRANYDYIVIDCPPGTGLLTANAMAAAGEVILIVQPEVFSLQGIRLFQKLFDAVKTNVEPKLAIAGLLITMIDGKSRGKLAVHRDSERCVMEEFEKLVFATRIRLNTRLKEAPGLGKTIFEHAPDCAGAADYKSLAEEILNHGHGRGSKNETGTGGVESAA